MPPQIATADLTPADVPPRGAGWEAVWRFARTFDGYAHAGRRADPTPPASDHPVWRLGVLLGNPARAAFLADGTLPGTLDDVRACLYWEWRRLHARPVGDAVGRYLHALVEAIRRAVAERDRGAP